MKLIEKFNISEGLSVDTDIKSSINSDLEGRKEPIIMMKEQNAVEVDLPNNRCVESALGDFEVTGAGNGMKKMFEKVDLNSSLLTNHDSPLKKDLPRHSLPLYPKPSEKENVIDSKATKYDGPSDDSIVNHNENPVTLEKAEEFVPVHPGGNEKVSESNSNNKIETPLQEVNENTSCLKNLKPKLGESEEKDMLEEIVDEASLGEVNEEKKQMPNSDSVQDVILGDEEIASCSNSSPLLRVSQSPPLSPLSSNESRDLCAERTQVENEKKTLKSCTDTITVQCRTEQGEVNVFKCDDNEGPECSTTACEPIDLVVSCADESNIRDPDNSTHDSNDELDSNVGSGECSRSENDDKAITYIGETDTEVKEKDEIDIVSGPNEIQEHVDKEGLENIENGESSKGIKQSDIPDCDSGEQTRRGENENENDGNKTSSGYEEKKIPVNESDTGIKDKITDQAEQNNNPTCNDVTCASQEGDNFKNEFQNNSTEKRNSGNKEESILTLRENTKRKTEIKEITVEEGFEKHEVLNEKAECDSNNGDTLLTSPLEKAMFQNQDKPGDVIVGHVDTKTDKESAECIEDGLEKALASSKGVENCALKSDEKLNVEGKTLRTNSLERAIQNQDKPEDVLADHVDKKDKESTESIEDSLEKELVTSKSVENFVSKSDKKMHVEGKSMTTFMSKSQANEILEDDTDTRVQDTPIALKSNTENDNSFSCSSKEAIIDMQCQNSESVPDVSDVPMGENVTASNSSDRVHISTEQNEKDDTDNFEMLREERKPQESDLTQSNEVRNRRKRFSPHPEEDKTVSKLKRTRTGCNLSVPEGRVSQNVNVRKKLNKSEINKESSDSTVKRPSNSQILTEVKKVRVMPVLEKQNMVRDKNTEKKNLDTCDSTTEVSCTDVSPVKKVTRLSFLREMNHAKLKKLTRNDLEELVLQKICEAITERSTCGELRQQTQSLEQIAKHWQKKYSLLTKQVKDLSMVVRRFQSDWEQKKEANDIVMPLKITRSVGLQVGSLFGLSNDVVRQRERTSTSANSTPTSSNHPKTPTSPPSLPSFARTELSTPQKVTEVNSASMQSTPPRHLPLQQNLQSTGIKVLQNRSPPANSSPISANKSIAMSSSSSSSVVSRSKPSDLKVIDLTDEEDKSRTNILAKSTSSTTTTVSSSIVPNIGNRPVHIVQQITGTSTPTLFTSTATNAGAGQPVAYFVPRTGVPVSPRQLVLSSASPVRPAGVMTVTSRSALVLKNPQVVPMTQTTGSSSNVLRSSASNSLPMVSQKSQQVKISPPVQRVPVVTSTVQSLKHPAPLPVTTTYGENNLSWKRLPPKPDLKISKVLNRNQQGIVLSWNMTVTSDNEEIASYQLFAYQEGTTPPNPSLWKKVGDVKALPLPMACTLTQFMEGHKYHFAVRAVDVHMRCGPFSAPGNIVLTRS